MEIKLFKRLLFVFHIENPCKTYRKALDCFKAPKKHIYIGKVIQGFPLYYSSHGKILTVWSNDIIWKDKFNSPRFEFPASINICFFRKWQIYICWESPVKEYHSFFCLDDCYWEAVLWYLYYGKTPEEACELVSGWELEDLSYGQYRKRVLTKEDVQKCILKQ